MESLGAEVSQKMRSAIKAKLMELGCYVDNELPDYIMVMVANKRTKSQMNSDLRLFLAAKTESFVEWLSIVLKKLKEVTVTNPEVYRKVSKHKMEDASKPDIKPNIKLKKEKKEKSKSKKSKKKDENKVPIEPVKSLTDDLPINANSLAEKRKIVIAQENQRSGKQMEISEDNFDIPPLSQAGLTDDADLEEIHRKIRSVKSRLGLHVPSDSEDDCLNIKAESEDFLNAEEMKKNNKNDESNLSLNDSNAVTSTTSFQDKNKHPRIVFEAEELEVKKRSVLNRLGRRNYEDHRETSPKRRRTDPDSRRNDEETNPHKSRKRPASPRDSILKRLGVMSKVAVPEKKQETEEVETVIVKEVPSSIKIKPRTLPPTTTQANKNLLLKAVAEAQRSIAQTPVVGSSKPDALFTKKFRGKLQGDTSSSSRKISGAEKNKLKNMIMHLKKDNTEYIPKPVREIEPIEYVPTYRDVENDSAEKKSINQQFIITLDGIQRVKSNLQTSVNVQNAKPKNHTDIVFDLDTSEPVNEKIPPILPVKTKEKCRYWPACKQGSKCEFLHPTTPCKTFPQCKFGDKCIYIHPSCKFETSCTRKDCPYNHAPKSFKTKTTIAQAPICKYYPNCSNMHCNFYHPKPCKFGNFCKNQNECTFSHLVFGKAGNLTWRPSVN